MKRGFVLLFAILISSVILAVGMGAFNISIRELKLSSAGRDSQVAFYWADTGSECVFYWERKFPGLDDTPFQYMGELSTIFASDPTIVCVGQDIRKKGGVPSAMVSSGSDYWRVSSLDVDINGVIQNPDITTTFIVSSYVGEAERAIHPCARVTVNKKYCTNLGGFIKTTVTSEGFSTCKIDDPRTVKRTIENAYPNLTCTQP